MDYISGAGLERDGFSFFNVFTSFQSLFQDLARPSRYVPVAQ
jgi:hypothetical protein